MDVPSSELARQGLAEYENQLSPLYADIQERLLGELAVNGRILDNLKLDAKHTEANRDMVNGLILTLPNAPVAFHENGAIQAYHYGAATPDAATARLVQAHTLWRNVFDGNSSGTVPYYLVGVKAVTPERRAESDASILLAPAFGGRGAGSKAAGFVEAAVHRNEFEAFEALQQGALFRSYSEEELQAMFDPATKQLIIKSSTPGSLALKEVIRRTQQRKFRGQSPQELAKAMSPIESLRARPHAGTAALSNQVMAEYNVPHYLNRLATAFGRVKLLDKLLETHAVDTVSFTDQLVEGDS